MIVRPAVVEDVAEVLPMMQRICALHEEWDPAKYGFLPEPAKRYDRWLRGLVTDSRGVFLVAEREGSGGESRKLAGFLVGTVEREIPIYRVKEYGFIHDVWVEEAYRHEGLARQMVMQAIEAFSGMGTAQVRADTAAANAPARRLLETCGFRAATTEMLLELRRV